MSSSVRVKHHGDTLKDPVTDVHVGLQVGLHHQSDTHCVGTELRDINWRLDRTSQLQLVRLNRNDLDQWHLFDQDLGDLVVEAVLFKTPSRTLNIQSLNVRALLESLGHFVGIEDLRDIRVHRGLVEGPSLRSAGGLNKRCTVGLRNRKTRKPDDLRLLDVNPVPILSEPSLIMVDPVDQVLLRLRCEFPPKIRQLTVEECRT